MNTVDYKRFKNEYLHVFRGIYKRARRPQKKLLKEEVLNNPNLTTKQKENFLKLMLEK